MSNISIDFKTFSSAFHVDTTHFSVAAAEHAKKTPANQYQLQHFESYCQSGLSITGKLLEQLHERLSALEQENKQLIERITVLEANIKHKKD